MYRKPSPRRQAALARRLEAMRAGKERAALARGPSPRAPELPLLRREVTITDHDTGQPITHTLRLLRSNRVDTYRVECDGQPWRRAGWSAVLAMLRRAYPRIPSPRNDFWRDD